MSQPPLSTPAADWVLDLAEEWRGHAREHERAARRLRALAAKVENPPEGVRVELWSNGSVALVGPSKVHRGR